MKLGVGIGLRSPRACEGEDNGDEHDGPFLTEDGGFYFVTEDGAEYYQQEEA